MDNSNMKPGIFSFEGMLQDLVYRVNPTLRVNDVEIENSGRTVKIFHLQGVNYISLNTVNELITFYGDITRNVQDFLREIVSIYKSEECGNVELCRIDHLTDHIFSLVCKKFKDLSAREDESMFKKIDITPPQANLNNECPFEQPWAQEDIGNILSKMYSANDFLDHVEDKKKITGRGRCKVKQANIKDRPFVCEYPECKRAFKRFEHLKRHNKMHTGERPYKCKYPGCMKSFSRSDNLAQHFKIHSGSTGAQALHFRNYYESNKHLE